MERDSRKEVGEEGFAWGPDTLEAEIRSRIRGMIETIVEEELEATLVAGRSQRVSATRTGYRHGARERQLTTSLGKTTIMLPRARLKGGEGEEREWHSRLIGRYQRRNERVDAALLGTYLSGINSRRLRGALSPLLRGAPLSKDAVSRLVGRLRDEFSAWSERDLAAEEVCYIFTQTLQVGTLNGSFLLNFQGLYPGKPQKWKRLLLVGDRPSNPKFPLTIEKKYAFAWGIVQRGRVLLTTLAAYRVSPSSWRACFCGGVGRVTISKGATDLSMGWMRFLTMVARSWSKS